MIVVNDREGLFSWDEIKEKRYCGIMMVVMMMMRLLDVYFLWSPEEI